MEEEKLETVPVEETEVEAPVAETEAETTEVAPAEEEQTAVEPELPALTDKLYAVTFVARDNGSARVENLVGHDAVEVADKAISHCAATEYVHEVKFAGVIHG